MRRFFFAIAIVAAFFALTAEDNNSNDLYQQYLNQYNNNQPQPAPAQAEPAKPAEEKKEEAAQPAPAPAEEKKEEAAQPAPAEEKKEEAQPAPAEEKKEEPAPAEQPAEEKKEEAQPAPAEQPAEEKKEEPAPVEAAAPAKEVEKLAPFETNPFFSANAFMALSNSIYTFGGHVMPHSSYRFGIDNAVLDFKGGNRMFNGRILVDLAKGLKTTKEVEFNYDYDDTLPEDGTNPHEFIYVSDAPNALDILKDVSFKMVHPSFRNEAGTLGLNIELQAGLFGLPFGVEGGYDHEITYGHSAIKNEFLGGAFRDVGVSLGFDVLLASNMDLDMTLFVFNGKNATMLDGEDKFKDPAFGFDIRFNYESDFFATAAFSFVLGSAYMGYDEDADGGIFQTTNGTYLDEKNKIEENLILKDDSIGRNDYAINKKNIILAVGADLGYNINDDVTVAFKGEFAYSNRSMFNPYANVFLGKDYYENARFIRDGDEGVVWGKSSYNPFGFFVMPYAHVYWFDMMARFSYYKQPYLYSYLEDAKNTVMGVDFAFIYNFCDYAGVEFDYNYINESYHYFDPEVASNDPTHYYANKYNTHIFTIALTGWFDFLWEGKTAESTEPEAAAE